MSVEPAEDGFFPDQRKRMEALRRAIESLAYLVPPQQATDQEAAILERAERFYLYIRDGKR